MELPGFTAESSLYNKENIYYQFEAYTHSNEVIPAQIPPFHFCRPVYERICTRWTNNPTTGHIYCEKYERIYLGVRCFIHAV